jgi:hypothetical protein
MIETSITEVELREMEQNKEKEKLLVAVIKHFLFVRFLIS